MTIIQVYALTTEAEEQESEILNSSIWEDIHHTPKEDMLIIIGDGK